MLRKAKKLFVYYWILKLQFFPVATVTGGEPSFIVNFPPEVIRVHPDGLSYQLQPVAPSVNKDSLCRILSEELVKYGHGTLPGISVYVLGGIQDLNDHDEGSQDVIAGLFAPGETLNHIYLEAGEYMINALHHEMASILMYNYYKNDPRYKKECRQFMKYLRKGYHYEGMEKELEFLNDHWQFLGSADYAMTDPENDYSLVAEYLFNPRPIAEMSGEVAFWTYMDWAEVLEYPVYEKVQRVIALYNQINPVFTEAYFRQLESASGQGYQVRR